MLVSCFLEWNSFLLDVYVYVSAGRCPTATARAGILSESEIGKCSRPMRYENDYSICHALYYMLQSLHCASMLPVVGLGRVSENESDGRQVCDSIAAWQSGNATFCPDFSYLAWTSWALMGCLRNDADVYLYNTWRVGCLASLSLYRSFECYCC